MSSDHNTIDPHRDPIDQAHGPIDHTCGAIGQTVLSLSLAIEIFLTAHNPID